MKGKDELEIGNPSEGLEPKFQSTPSRLGSGSWCLVLLPDTSKTKETLEKYDIIWSLKLSLIFPFYNALNKKASK